MSHHDDSNDSPPVPDGPVILPTPEPLVPAEPLPFSGAPTSEGIESDIVSAPLERESAPPVEPSWRNILATRPTDLSAEAGSAKEEMPVEPPIDTTAGTLGDEPMGGAPREDHIVEPSEPEPASELRVLPLPAPDRPQASVASRVGEELFAWLKTLASAAVYATLIVTFGFQVARSKARAWRRRWPIRIADRNKLAYRIGTPQVGDLVMPTTR